MRPIALAPRWKRKGRPVAGVDPRSARAQHSLDGRVPSVRAAVCPLGGLPLLGRRSRSSSRGRSPTGAIVPVRADLTAGRGGDARGARVPRGASSTPRPAEAKLLSGPGRCQRCPTRGWRTTSAGPSPRPTLSRAHLFRGPRLPAADALIDRPAVGPSDQSGGQGSAGRKAAHASAAARAGQRPGQPEDVVGGLGWLFAHGWRLPVVPRIRAASPPLPVQCFRPCTLRRAQSRAQTGGRSPRFRAAAEGPASPAPASLRVGAGWY